MAQLSPYGQVATDHIGNTDVVRLQSVSADAMFLGYIQHDISSTVPTVTENAFAQRLTPADSIGIYFSPAAADDANDGMLTFGDVNNQFYTGSINYV